MERFRIKITNLAKSIKDKGASIAKLSDCQAIDNVEELSFIVKSKLSGRYITCDEHYSLITAIGNYHVIPK